MKINKLGIAGIVIAILSVTMITCVDQAVQYQQDAVLLSLKIGDVEVEVIPRPITETQWNSETFGLAGADFGRASFNSAESTTDQRIIATVNPGSRAEWGVATRGTKPPSFTDMRVPATFSDQDYIYIKVNSNDNTTTTYYRVYTRLKEFVTDLNSISIESRVGKAKGGESTWNHDPDEFESAEISITVGESTNATITAVTYDPNATVEYAAVREGSSAVPVFTAAEVPLPLRDQDTLYVRVTAENTIAKEYFKFRVDVGRMATIKTLKFTGGPKGDKEVFGKGLPQDEWERVTAGTFSTAKNDQPNGGFTVNIELDDPAAKKAYVKYLTADTGDPSFGSTSPAKVEFASGDSLAIKIESVNGGITNYYKVKVTLLAGNIMEHPKSAWYKKGATAADLTVVLDPPDTGQYTYQWYEADSWYGIYGRHGYAVDEKANVSCVNGGPGQYFYLVQPDVIPSGGPLNVPQASEYFAWSIAGATSSKYKPPTDWVDGSPHGATANSQPAVQYPYTSHKIYFLAGSTNETRYYWVKVRDKNTGLEVVSDRAVILTETDPRADHFIFELSKLPRKNLIPFVKKNEVYQIDLRDYPFPEGFDPSKYEICIAHAQYFLPDGRPWTQNWTHGDLHFGYTEGTASYRANGGPLTWWHNNMGSNSGSIPLQAPHAQKGGLEYRPDWVGFAPSGDPAKGIPRPDPNTGELPKGIYSMKEEDGYPAGVAQGYFAGFIELLELRFQTAPTR